MIIVHVAEYASGGVATYLRNLISEQLNDERVEKVILINSNYNSESFDFHSSKFINAEFDYKRSIIGIFKLLSIRKIIDSYDPDVVHYHSSFAGLVRFTYFVKSAKYKVIYCAHGWSFNKEDISKIKKWIFKVIEMILSIKTSTIINISKDEQEKSIQLGLPIDKMYLIYNSIPSKIEYHEIVNPYENDKECKKILFIGRFDKQKGLDFLLKNIDFEEYNIELVMIGGSVLESNEPVALPRNVKSVGWVENNLIDSYIKFCDAVIVPSRWEGFGLVALEACKNSKMVIASDVGGLPEIVRNGFNGLVFKSESIEMLNDVISKFHEMSKDRIKLMGINGRKLFDNKYNYEKLYNRLMDIYII
ncbi:glycosyltransferase [Companilactobacillus sp. HBUAS59699]|uniref:glycosyltransferase n=1 Tax=Companilactobacillus sp. HBUAS59699 TaxID=3109358 RepID=UPI002FEEB362